MKSIIGAYEWKWLVPSSIRRVIRAVIPGIKAEDLNEVGSQIFNLTGGRVMAGPFRGLHYINSAAGSAFSPKLLGTYEKEVSQIVESVLGCPYELLVDIGAAEGYYAVGIAHRRPDMRIIAFEQSDSARQLLQSLAERNNLGNRIGIRACCTHAELRGCLSSAARGLVICDIDGGEFELLDPQLVPALLRVDMLVELHDCFQKGISQEIRRRFEKSHSIQTIWSRPRRAWDCPLNGQVSRRNAFIAVQEHRPAQQSWFWMEARDGPS